MLNNNNMLNMNNMSLDPNLLNLQNSNLTNDINAGNVFLPKNDNPLVNSQGEQTDIYGITNTETIYCFFSEKTEFSKHENIKIRNRYSKTAYAFCKCDFFYLIIPA